MRGERPCGQCPPQGWGQPDTCLTAMHQCCCDPGPAACPSQPQFRHTGDIHGGFRPTDPPAPGVRPTVTFGHCVWTDLEGSPTPSWPAMSSSPLTPCAARLPNKAWEQPRPRRGGNPSPSAWAAGQGIPQTASIHLQERHGESGLGWFTPHWPPEAPAGECPAGRGGPLCGATQDGGRPGCQPAVLKSALAWGT